jgi:TetR/AcrR family transcriptional regulator, tetracycline repressor protein
VPRPGLTRDRIVAAALDLVDDAGLDGLSMRKLAARLGVDPMALYRHIADKQALLGALCDHLIEGLAPVDPDGPWEPQLRRLAEELHAAMLARPALVPVLVGAPLTPAAVEAAGPIAALLRAHGLDARAFGVVFGYVLGAAALEAAGAPPELEGVGEGEAVDLLRDPGDFAYGLDVVFAGLRASGS